CCCYPLHLFFLVMSPPPPRSTLFPYTTLFRSCALESRISRRRNGGGANVRGKSARGAKGIGRKKDAGPGGCLPLPGKASARTDRSEEHTSELQSLRHLVCRLLLEKKKKKTKQ